MRDEGKPELRSLHPSALILHPSVGGAGGVRVTAQGARPARSLCKPSVEEDDAAREWSFALRVQRDAATTFVEEHAVGFEPTFDGFAARRLSAWLRVRERRQKEKGKKEDECNDVLRLNFSLFPSLVMREEGVEPSERVWKTRMLPLYHSRV